MPDTPPTPAILAFADGIVFSGTAAGHPGIAIGEAVFNTAICGYQEIVSDPSYYRQIVNFTHPHIGNTGATSLDDECADFAAAGIVARRIASYPHWRAQCTLDDYLRARQIPAIAGIDTRAVTCKLRDGGAIAACIAPGNDEKTRQNAIAAAAAFGGLTGAMLAAESGQSRATQWREGLWRARENDYAAGGGRRVVAVLDCGVKSAILRQLAARGCDVRVLQYDTDFATIQKCKPDGVIFSNGPGDPEPCAAAIALARELMHQKTPLLGICLGHQIIAAALGAKIVKMKFGHHGANHPVRDEETGRVLITSQNHGFAADAASLPANTRITHTSLFDGSLQGIACDSPPIMTFQGHPEASPGPHDAAILFDRFINLMDERKAG